MRFNGIYFNRKDGKPLEESECASIASILRREPGAYGAVLREDQNLYISCNVPDDRLVPVLDRLGYKPLLGKHFELTLFSFLLS